MNVLLIAVNSSYVHTNPAVRSLAVRIAKTDTETKAAFCEYNINQHLHDILQDILGKRPDVACFSCYIWNIRHVLKLAADLKKVCPRLTVILGGPEASFDARELLEKHPFVDIIVCGEAEELLPSLLKRIEVKQAPVMEHVLYRDGTETKGSDKYARVSDLATLPGPFALPNDKYDPNRIYYYESSRGCPFACAYCLSGAIGGGVREKPLTLVKQELARFVQKQVKLVKFVDRTFNANRERAAEILDYVLRETGETAFHFEIALDLLDEELLRLLRAAPVGKIQLEAGVQSCNAAALQAALRHTDFEKLERNAKRIVKQGNIHLHLDLIAGLPYESLESFSRSFDRVYGLYPDALQLGFLKLLKGTKLRRDAERYGIVYRDYPPYEVLQTDDISAEELLHLKEIETLVNRYYNTGRARTALDYVTKNKLLGPFELYEKLARFGAENGFAARPVSARNQFVLLIEFAKEALDEAARPAFFQNLRRDYIRTKIKGIMPPELDFIH